MHVKHIVELTGAERESLETFVSSGSKLARKVKRGQILLAADQGYPREEALPRWPSSPSVPGRASRPSPLAEHRRRCDAHHVARAKLPRIPYAATDGEGNHGLHATDHLEAGEVCLEERLLVPGAK